MKEPPIHELHQVVFIAKRRLNVAKATGD